MRTVTFYIHSLASVYEYTSCYLLHRFIDTWLTLSEPVELFIGIWAVSTVGKNLVNKRPPCVIKCHKQSVGHSACSCWRSHTILLACWWHWVPLWTRAVYIFDLDFMIILTLISLAHTYNVPTTKYITELQLEWNKCIQRAFCLSLWLRFKLVWYYSAETQACGLIKVWSDGGG